MAWSLSPSVCPSVSHIGIVLNFVLETRKFFLIKHGILSTIATFDLIFPHMWRPCDLMTGLMWGGLISHWSPTSQTTATMFRIFLIVSFCLLFSEGQFNQITSCYLFTNHSQFLPSKTNAVRMIPVKKPVKPLPCVIHKHMYWSKLITIINVFLSHCVMVV